MRRKITILTAVGLCLVLALGATLAAERGRDGTADRSKRTTTDAGTTGVASNEQNSMLGGNILMNRAENSNGVNKARGLLASSYKQDGDEAVATLNQILGMQLPDTPEADKILSNVYTALAEQHNFASAKEARYLGMALRYTSDPGRRAGIQSRIQELGGDPVSFAFNGSSDSANTGRTFGWADTCGSPDNGVITMTAAGDAYSDTGVDIEAGGDQDWYTIDVVTGDAGLGLILNVQTCTDNPGSYEDDTDIYLYDACGGTELYFGGDGGCNGYFMSEFTTGCMGEGTYYLDVEGWLGSGEALNIDVNVTALAGCAVPMPDSYEPDDVKADAGPISHPKPYDAPDYLTSGHVALDIQAHSIFPAGDVDFMSFTLKESAIVMFETANCFPTIFNGFDPACNNGSNQPDTILSVMYPFDNAYGGLCNQQTSPGSLTIIGPPCQDDSWCDLDGDGLVYPDDDDLVYPVVGYPACLPWSLFGHPERELDTPLADNDDKAAGVWSSALELCLPRTYGKSPESSVEMNGPDFAWYVKVVPWGASDSFDYEVFVHNHTKCNFEVEPNGDFAVADSATSPKRNESNHITLGESVSGIYDYRRDFEADWDLFSFDVTEETYVIFETDGYDSYAVDTYIELFVGPDDFGNYYTTGVWGEDNGPGWMSRIEVILPPACELLGVECPDLSGKGKKGKSKGQHNEGPSYWIGVTSNYWNPNFPYTLNSRVAVPPLEETTDFGDYGSGTEQEVNLGEQWIAAIDPECDYDGYKISLANNTAIDFFTTGFDSSMQIVECDTGEVLACDEDSAGSLASEVTGCLPGGHDYCIRIRAYSGYAVYPAYTVDFTGVEGCTASWPPVLTMDAAYTCGDFPGSVLFDTCP
jgi:hypothetical protein